MREFLRPAHQIAQVSLQLLEPEGERDEPFLALIASIADSTCARLALKASSGGGAGVRRRPFQWRAGTRRDARERSQHRLESRQHLFGQRLGPDAPDQHQIVTHPAKRARHRLGIGVVGEVIALLARGFIGNILQRRQRHAHRIVPRLNRVRIRGATSPSITSPSRSARRCSTRFAALPISAWARAGQHEQRDRHADKASQADFDGAQSSREERAFGAGRTAEQKNHRRDRGDAIARVERREERKRRQRNRQRHTQHHDIVMRHERGNRRPVDRAQKRAHEPVDGGLPRAAHASLHHQHGREHRPIALRQTEHFRRHIAQHAGGCDAQAVPYFRTATRQNRDKTRNHRGANLCCWFLAMHKQFIIVNGALTNIAFLWVLA